MFWQITNSSIPGNYTQLTEILLQNRNILDVEAFLHPVAPWDLQPSEVGIVEAELSKAVARLSQAREKQEQVVVFGDYDADGICATAVLWETLYAAGIQATPFIPHRERHGYGLSSRAVAELLQSTQRPSLVVTVDNGIVAQPAITELQSAGIDVIVTDHHQTELTGYPDALAVVHTTQLCGTTVAWFLARAVTETLGLAHHDLDQYHGLDLATLATVADQVPLQGANRSFVWHGLQYLQKTQRLGIKELMQLAGLQPQQIAIGTINYALAPRLNAMGRLEHGLDALRLLCTVNPERAHDLAETLASTNVRRQDLTQALFDDAVSQAERMTQHHILVVASPDYHEGVIGLIAGRLVEKYSKPAIVLSISENKVKASARSIPEVNIVNLIREIREHLLEVGGHPMAAGFSLLPTKLEEVTGLLQDLALDVIDREWLQPHLKLDCVLPAALISTTMLENIQKLAPFGQGNPEPIFAIQDVTVIKKEAIGANKQHAKFWVESDPDMPALQVMIWNKAALLDEIELQQPVKVAGSLSFNEWKGKKSLQIIAKDIRPA